MTVAEAKKKIEYYCAYQERCHKEVEEKLKSYGMYPQAIEHIIGHLLKENYLNEERFARSFARGKFRTKGWGKNRIIRELKLRNISRFNITASLKEIPDEDYEQALDTLANKRAQELKEKNPLKKKKKLADYLLYRGWESHLVYSKVNELI